MYPFKGIDTPQFQAHAVNQIGRNGMFPFKWIDTARSSQGVMWFAAGSNGMYPFKGIDTL